MGRNKRKPTGNQAGTSTTVENEVDLEEDFSAAPDELAADELDDATSAKDPSDDEAQDDASADSETNPPAANEVPAKTDAKPPVENTPPAELIITLKIPFGDAGDLVGFQGKSTRHLELAVTTEQDLALRRVFAALSQGDFHLKKTRRNAPHLGSRVFTKMDALRWLLDQIGDQITASGGSQNTQ